LCGVPHVSLFYRLRTRLYSLIVSVFIVLFVLIHYSAIQLGPAPIFTASI